MSPFRSLYETHGCSNSALLFPSFPFCLPLIPSFSHLHLLSPFCSSIPPTPGPTSLLRPLLLSLLPCCQFEHARSISAFSPLGAGLVVLAPSHLPCLPTELGWSPSPSPGLGCHAQELKGKIGGGGSEEIHAPLPLPCRGKHELTAPGPSGEAKLAVCWF